MPQAGLYVVFVPFENGKPTGKWEVFADNFSGSAENTAKANAVFIKLKQRTSGLER